MSKVFDNNVFINRQVVPYGVGSGVSQGSSLFGFPTLYVDFANVLQTLDPRITFTRASSGTRFDSTGTLVSMSNDQPRFDYDPVTGAPKGLLIEEQRTNLLTYSEQFDNAAWTKGNSAVVTANQIAAPDGSLSADFVSKTASGAYVNQYKSAAAGAYTASVFMKAGTLTKGSFTVLDNSTIVARSVIDLTTGNVTNVSGVTTTKKYGDGWWLVSASVTTTSGVLVDVYAYPGTYNVTESGGIYIWGAQLEAGAFPTSYIPTTTASATRAADVATMTGTNFSSWYNQTEGTLFGENYFGGTGSGGTTRILQTDDGSEANRIVLADTSVNARAIVTTASVGQADFSTSFGSNSLHKSAVVYKLNDIQAAANGTLGVGDTSASIPTVSLMRLGGFVTGVTGAIWLRRIAYYPRRLSNTELQSLTA